MKAFIVAVLLLSVAGLAVANPIPSVCNADFAKSPWVTPQKDGSMYICSAVPAAYISKKQAQQAALGMNKEQAQRLCSKGFSYARQPQTLDYPLAVAVVSLVVCN